MSTTPPIARWVYAVDGSGVELSTECSILDGPYITPPAGHHRIAIWGRADGSWPSDISAVLRYSPESYDVRYADSVPAAAYLTVPEDSILQPGERPRVHSFGWLD